MSARQALSLGLTRTGVKSYQVLSNALDALAEAGTPTPCAGRAADFTALDCRQCPVQRLCHDHGNKFEEAPEWHPKPSKKNTQQKDTNQ